MYLVTRKPTQHMGGTPAGPLRGLSDDPFFLQKCSGRAGAICPNGVAQPLSGFIEELPWTYILLGGAVYYFFFRKR